MNKPPEIQNKLNGYIVRFLDEGLIATISSIRSHSRDGRVTGELTITTNTNSPTILLPSTSFNFSADRTRNMQAKSLADKYGLPKVNWVEIFDYLGHKIQELARTGEDAAEVWASDEIVPIEWLLDPIIIKGQPNIIFGEKGVSKSTLAYICGAILCVSWYDNPLELAVCEHPVTALVLDWERDRAAFDYYLSRIKRGMNTPAFRLFYRRCNMPLLEDIEAIAKKIEETGAQLLIIDSLGRAAGGQDVDLKGSSAADGFLRALRSLNITSLIIAQTSKPQFGDRTSKKTIYGSTFFTYYASNVLELCHSEDDTGDSKHLALFHRENNFSRKSAPIGLRMDFKEDGGINLERESVSISEFSAKINTQQRILDLLKSGKMEVKDIAETLDISRNSCQVALTRLKKRNKIIKIGKEYGLASERADQSEF